MFESVVPEAVGVKRSRRLLYETLPLSLAAHALVAAGAVGTTIWNVEFPGQSPRMYTTYSLVEPPPPPPPPPPPAPKRVDIQPVAKPVALKLPLVAPPFIPDEIPIVTEVQEAPVPVEEVPPDTTSTMGGTVGGIEGGEVGGVIGGMIGGLAAQPLPDLVKIERDLPLPMTSVSQEFPVYPEYAKSRGWEDTLVVRYVIDKRGKVKEVSVITPPAREEFARAAVDAIRHWRFHPFRDEKGEPREVVHELTVEFKIVRTRRR